MEGESPTDCTMTSVGAAEEGRDGEEQVEGVGDTLL
jgi:hypothetical protein